MISEAFKKRVFEIQPEGILENAPMSEYTTFKVGGNADMLVTPKDIQALSALIALCRKEAVPFSVIGAGSNLLVSDRGVDGVIIRLAEGFDTITTDGTVITAGAGVSLAKLAKTAQRASLSGLEFASGIPGTLGGAIYMNAGAYGGEMKDVVTETTFLDDNSNIRTVSGAAHDFSYRKSVFGAGGKYILSAKLTLTPKNADEIAETMRDLNSRRKEKQPLDKASAGSTFKRPEGFFAAKLIEDAGLKGASVGGASVSKKHAGFIVNDGSATADDILALIRHVQSTVKEQFGVLLETEVKFIGRK